MIHMNKYFNEKNTYVIHKPFDHSVSLKQLMFVYGPIIGEQGIVLYQWLLNEYNIQNELKGISSPIERILKSLNISLTKFASIRERLEGMKLLVTYVEQQSPTKRVFHFEIKKPLNWKAFNENQKYRHLLIDAIGLSEYERISLVFVGSRIPNNALNISATFNSVYKSDDLKEMSEFNFEQLHKLLSNELNKPILLSDNSKLIIETYFKSNNFTLEEIKECVCKSICEDPETQIPTVDDNELTSQFRLLVNGANNVTAFSKVDINRDAEFFFGNLSKQREQLILSDYRNINPECYLSSIQKGTLTQEQKDTIFYLQNQAHLTDEIINMITDFMFFRINGKYSSNYLKKIANTINCLGLSSLDAATKHLRSVCESINANTCRTKEIVLEHNTLPTTKEILSDDYLDSSDQKIAFNQDHSDENEQVDLGWIVN